MLTESVDKTVGPRLARVLREQTRHLTTVQLVMKILNSPEMMALRTGWTESACLTMYTG